VRSFIKGRNIKSTLMPMLNFTLFPIASSFSLAAPWLGPIQAWFVFQTFVVGGMGIASFLFPGLDAITMGGYWEYVGETADAKKDSKVKTRVLAPNARSRAVRSEMQRLWRPHEHHVMCMYVGTRECYAIMAACAAYRETIDSIQCVMEGGDMPKKAFTGYIIPSGKFPQMIYFPPWAGGAVMNYFFLYYIHSDGEVNAALAGRVTRTRSARCALYP